MPFEFAHRVRLLCYILGMEKLVPKNTEEKEKNHRANERTNGRSSERAIGCVDEPDEHDEEETNVREEEEAQKLYVYDRLSYLFV